MKKFSMGVSDDSKIYFSSPSVKAKNLYYHVLCAGHFFCDNNYHLVRDNYESILILHVIKGTFTFKNNEGGFSTAKENETVIIDCYKKHEYYTDGFLESVWVHVAGVNSREICSEIIKENGHIVKNMSDIKRRILRLTDGIKPETMMSEVKLSLEIYKLFAEFITPVGKCGKENSEDVIQEVKDYILNNLSDKMSVEKLSGMVHMSPTHFSRLFKKETGFSPYSYILSSRLNRAKELLLNSNKSVVEIAYETGFNSEANFIYCFKKSEGSSPGRFRKMIF